MSKTIDDFTRGYLIAALWSSTDDDIPLDSMYDIDDFDQSAVDKAVKDCTHFQIANAAALESYYAREAGRTSRDPDSTWMDYAGHDFWLTRNHHGCGFWDRGLGELGDQLTKASQQFDEIDLYVGDDGKLYFS